MPLRVRARAKTNLYLAIAGKRPDGYHDIDTIFQNVSLADDLIIEPAAEFSLAIETGDSLPPLSPADDNLILRAARAFREAAGPGRIPGAAFHLVKRIPFGAGMGGGSADAAAAIAGLNELYRLNLDGATLHRTAVAVGMDVAFFLMGGTARASGRGEILTPLPRRLDPWLVMVFPGFPIATARAYALWRERRGRLAARPPADAMQGALAAGDWEAFRRAIHNDFEALLAEDYPRIADIKREIIGAGCEAAWLSGSGAAVMGAAMDAGRIERVAAALRERYPCVSLMRFASGALDIESV